MLYRLCVGRVVCLHGVTQRLGVTLYRSLSFQSTTEDSHTLPVSSVAYLGTH